LAFLFFAITGLHRKLRKESTKPVHAATVYSVAGISPVDPNPFASRHWERAAWKKNFRSIFRESPKKYFGSIAHNEQSSKNYFAAKRGQTSSASSFEMHSVAIIASNRHDAVTSCRC